ncbi:polysaccharide biosynthesis/export family protein [Plebeiibacterium sediminum]|uniref:Polysaccharide biosynthesis/export family protein n=1 Tax=Plebeiibacterium sediminum TaxID=2992112 RepID=A0AAE3M4Q9_9BACT|nr:polysaccharide biosynthesis/export family protein [Plebeiobacterium sediminum]MCW3786640.1 polysaccharide biosynthesis/export family protein [Plebeiobacterium sediminum]
MNKLILTVFLTCLLYSCTSRKNITYFNDLENKDFQQAMPIPAPIHRIKPKDNLYINIQTLNPEINALFNPSTGNGGGNGTSQTYGEGVGQYINGFLVDDDGYVTLPIIGKVNVKNKTIQEARESIQVQAQIYIKDATIKVKLLNFKFTVLGEVTIPGIYYNYNNYITILDAISMAKGETDNSNLKRALIIRQTKDGTMIYYRINLTSGQDLLQSQAYYLQPNDIVYIEPQKNKSLKINSTVYSLVFSSISTLVLLVNFINK